MTSRRSRSLSPLSSMKRPVVLSIPICFLSVSESDEVTLSTMIQSYCLLFFVFSLLFGLQHPNYSHSPCCALLGGRRHELHGLYRTCNDKSKMFYGLS